MTTTDDEAAIEYLGRKIHDSPKTISWESMLFALICHTELLELLLINRGVNTEEIFRRAKTEDGTKLKSWHDNAQKWYEDNR